MNIVRILILLATITTSNQHVYAAAQVTVNLVTFPSGAETMVDGKSLGPTPISANIDVGLHNIRFSLAGYDDWNQNYAIYGDTITINAQLRNSGEFIQLPGEPISLLWSDDSNKFRFKSTSDTSKGSYDFDLDNKTILESNLPFGYVENVETRNKIGVQNTDKHSIYSVVYQSSSGRYIAYIPAKTQAQANPHLTLYDTKTQRILKTKVVFSEFVDDVMNPPFYLLWTADEQLVAVRSGRYQIIALIFLGAEETKTVFFRSFKNTTGQEVFIDKVFSGPSHQQTLLISGNVENQAKGLWLVRATDMQGALLQDKIPLSAVLSSDGRFAYLADAVSISRLDIESNNRTILSFLASDRGEVRNIELAPTGDYALITSGNTEAPAYWVYKIPHK